MKTLSTWNEKMQFQTSSGSHTFLMDAKAPIGQDTAPTPKELVLAALCGCSGMDVVSLLKKNKEPLEIFSVEAEAHTRTTHPAIFSGIQLTFRIGGAVSKERAIEAVRLSETKFCSVGAMLSKLVPITYSIELNGEEIARGQANFDALLIEADQGIA